MTSVSVIARTDHSICSQLRGVFEHQIECVRPGFLAKIGQQSNVAAEDCLQAGAERSENRSRSYHNSADDTEIPDYTKAVQFKLSCHHGVGDHLRAHENPFPGYDSSSVSITYPFSSGSYSICSTLGLQQTLQSSTYI
jgi:hypothetical protein